MDGRRILRRLFQFSVRRRFRVVLLVGLCLFFNVACSDGGDGDEAADIPSEVASLMKTVGPAADDWAKEASSAYMSQLAGGGALNALDLGEDVRTLSSELSRSICAEAKESNGINGTETQDEFALRVSQAIGETAAREFAVNPALLIGMGLNTMSRLPPFALNAPQLDPTTPVDSPAALAGLLRDDFLAEGGGIKIPRPGEPTYGDFQRWFYEPSLDNELLEHASATARPIGEALADCLG